MPLSDRYNAAIRSGQTSTPAATRWGIVILALLLLALIAFFFWYNNRPIPGSLPAPVANGTENDKGGFLARIFSPSAGTVPAIDTDNDGLDDAAEAQLGTDTTKADTDGDGLTDREEAKVYGTDPRSADTDGDGVSDGAEISQRRDPRDKNPAAVWPPVPSPDALKP